MCTVQQILPIAGNENKRAIVNLGLRQGCSLSPTLLNLCVDVACYGNGGGELKLYT